MPRTHAALIVDSDPKGLESLVYGFQGAGWRITACPTPETAPLLVKAANAEMVVVAARPDHDKVHTLVRQLRSRDVHRELPVLVLGPEDLRQPIKAHGDLDFLPLPAFVRDVLTASHLLVGAEKTSAAKPGQEPCFEDSITAQASLSLVRTMNGLRRSGALHLVRKGRHGEILFREGELTAAQVGTMQGMAAVQHLLVWTDGSLELRLRPVARRGQMHQTAQEFLEAFDRFQRDYSHALKDIGPPSSVYLVNHERLQAASSAIPAEVTPVVRLCDGQRSLCDVIDESPFRVLDTVRILGRLVELAVLNRRDPKPDASGELAPLDAFWASAQIGVGGEAAAPPTNGSKPTPAPATTSPSNEEAPMTAHPAAPLAPGARASRRPRPQRQTLELGKSAATASAEPARSVTPPAELKLERAPTTTAESAISAGAGPGAESRSETPAAQAPSPPSSESNGDKAVDVEMGVVAPGTPASAQTSGAFELRKGRREGPPRAGERRLSVVIDTALVDVLAAAPPDAGAATTAPADPPWAPAAEPVAVAAGSSPRLPSKDDPATTPPPLPSSETATPARSSDALPPATVAVSSTVVPTELSSPGARVTGEMQVASSGRARGQARVGVTSSFQIDPSLVSAPVAKPEPPSSTTVASPEPTHGFHRPSGSFSAVESDFFEREADLYKVEKSESFADLDDGKSKAAGKSKPADKRR